MRVRTADVVYRILRWIVALVFIYAGFMKILNPSLFAEQIDNYRMLPYWLVTITAVILPWLELLCGFLLIAGKWRGGAASLLTLLTLVFLIAIGSAMARGLDITCGCFGMTEAGSKVGWSKIGEDILLLALCGVVFYREAYRKIFS